MDSVVEELAARILVGELHDGHVGGIVGVFVVVDGVLAVIVDCWGGCCWVVVLGLLM